MMALHSPEPLPIEDEATEIEELDLSCAVCLIRHDPAIHAATLRLHRWFRKRLLQKIAEPDKPKPHKPSKFNPHPRIEEPKPVLLRQPMAKPALRQPKPKVWRKPAPPRISTRKVINPDDIRRLHAEGRTMAEMQQILGFGPTPIYKRMQDMELKFDHPRPVRVASGDVYGRLTVRHLLRSEPKRGRIFLCSCACGNENAEVAVKRLRNDKTTSCGCLAGAWRERTSPETAEVILRDVAAGTYSMSEVARRNKVSRTLVGRLIERKEKEERYAS